METISFKTLDGVTIIADWYSQKDPGGAAALLLHMMPSDRQSWQEFAQLLNQAGWAALAIDLRGHGDSINSDNGVLDFRTFTDQQHQNSIEDIHAALNWLQEKGFQSEKVVLIGASIGANLALWELAENKSIKAAVLLSPGLNYRGILTGPKAQKLQPEQYLFLAAATDDMRSGGNSASTMAQQLADLTSAQKRIVIYDGKEHGTDMFLTHPELMEEIVQWLSVIY